MRVKNNLIYYLFFLLLLSSVLIAIKTRFSYVNDMNLDYLNANSNQLQFAIVPSLENDLIDEHIQTITDLENNSNLVVRIEALDERSFKTKTLLTKCKIKEVYKGETSLLKNDYIYIYEPANFTFSYKSFISVNGYNYMKSNNEYIVFLNPLKVPQDYSKSNIDLLSFTFINSSFSKFLVNTDSRTIYIDKDTLDKGESYNNFISYEYIFTSPDIESKYIDLRNTILSKYIINRRH